MKVLDIDLFDKGFDEAIRLTLRSPKESNNKISATGVHGLVYAKKYPEFKDLLNSFYLNLPDGMPTVWIGKLKGAKRMQRCYGPDFFKEMMKASFGSRITHFLCGGKEGVADKLKSVCEKEFGSRISGTYCPPFLPVNAYNYKDIATRINSSKPNIVWISLSTPKQEQFAHYLSKYTKVDFICCVGAAFDFHVGNVRQAPGWIQKISMEWFFRLLIEPKRLWKRYIEIVPLFIYYNCAELVKGKFFKK